MQPRAFALLAALAAPACSHGGVEVNTTRTIAPQTIPGDPAAHQLAVANGLAVVPGAAIDVTITQPSMDTTGVTYIALTAMQFAIDPPSDGSATPCWDFVNGVTVSVASTRQGSQLPGATIATGANPGCVQTFTLTPDPSVDLAPYASEGFQLVVHTTGIPPAQNVTFEGSYQLTLSVL